MQAKSAECPVAGAIGKQKDTTMQSTPFNLRRSTGFVIIEAMVALMLVAFAALAISKITTMVLQSAGDSRARSEANVLAQAKLERMRNSLVESDFTTVAALGNTSESVTGATAAFTVNTNVTNPGGGAKQRKIEVSVAWTSATKEQQAVNVSTEVAWGNAENQAITNTGGGGGGTSAVTPRGAAQRINKDYGSTPPADAVSVPNSDNKAYVRKSGDTSELIVKVGDKYLGVLQTPGDFSRIQGGVYFDPSAKQLPNMNTFDLRLSSEGECVHNSSSGSTPANSSNGKTYANFGYTCFVGTGWYGNVGLSSSDLQGKSFQSCVGDPARTAVAKLTSPHGDLSPIRTYRGFEKSGSDYLSTGMANNSYYPNSEGSTIYGKPTPVDYGYTASGLGNQFNQHFYVTSITGQATCKSVMPEDIFAKNAGKFLCISPDNSTATDQCPDVWPNFEGYVASGGSGGGSGGGSTCTTVISGSTPTAYPNNKAKISISPTGTCKANGKDQANGYSCSGVTTAQGTTLTLTLVSNPEPTLTVTTTATCDNKTVNFY